MSVYWQRQHGMGEWVMHTASDADIEGVKQTNAGELAKTTSCGEWTAIDAERHGHWTTSKDNIIWGNA